MNITPKIGILATLLFVNANVLFRKIASKRMRINSKDISFISSCNNRFRLNFLDGRNIILE